MTPDTDSTTTHDTSTRRELQQHLVSIRMHAENMLARLERGDDPSNMQNDARELRSAGQRTATLTAYARALRPTEQARR